jgi:hypothetical protein
MALESIQSSSEGKEAKDDDLIAFFLSSSLREEKTIASLLFDSFFPFAIFLHLSSVSREGEMSRGKGDVSNVGRFEVRIEKSKKS